MRNQILTPLLGVFAALALMGCGQKKEEPRADNANIALEENESGAEAKFNQIGADLDRAADRAEQEARQAAEKIKQAASQGAEKGERAAQAARDDIEKDRK